MKAVSVALEATALFPLVIGLGFGPRYSQQRGSERLRGSSFGFPGTDAKFDYVVSFALNCLQCLTYFLCLSNTALCVFAGRF